MAPPRPDPVRMIPRTAPARPQACRCPRPLISDDTCFRCGRVPALMPEAADTPPGEPVTWTRAKVTRAIEAFAFFRGRAPVASDWSRRMECWPPLEIVQAMFGTVDAAAAAAGLKRSVRDVGI